MGLPLSLLAIYLYLSIFIVTKTRPGIANRVLLSKNQKPELCLTKITVWNNNKVSFRHNSLSWETAGARPSNSTPGAPAKHWMWTYTCPVTFHFHKIWSKLIDHSTVHSAYLRGGSPFTVKLKSTYRAHPQRKLCTFHFHKIGPRTHWSNWDASRRVTFLWKTER